MQKANDCALAAVAIFWLRALNLGQKVCTPQNSHLMNLIQLLV